MTSPKKRFTLDLEPEMQQRLKIVAALKGISMRQYCVNAIKVAMTKDPNPVSKTGAGLTIEGLARMTALRDEIFKGKKLPGDSTDIIREQRELRSEELDRRSRN